MLADTPWLVVIALKGLLILCAAWMVSLVLRRASAAARHLVWSMAVAALVVLPVMEVAVPDWRIATVPALEVGATHVGAPSADAQLRAEPVQGGSAVAVSAEPAPAVAQHPQPSAAPPRAWRFGERHLYALWLSGVLLVLASIGFGFLRVRVITRNARVISSGRVVEALNRLRIELGIGPVRACEGPAHSMPMTWGVVRPKLLLPVTARSWPSTRLDAVLRHELAHIRRRDAFWQLVAGVACALYWFNPLVWHASRRLRVEREHACDDAVLAAGSPASEYAAGLLAIARSLRAARATSLAAIAFAQPHQLEGRLLAVLDASRSRNAMRRQRPAWLAALVVILPVAAVSPDADAEAGAIADVTAPAITVAAPPASVPAATGQPAQPAFAAVGSSIEASQDPCFVKSRKLSAHSNASDDRQTFKWETSRCQGTLHIRGEVRLRGDLTGVESMSPGSDLRLWVKHGREIRTVTARPGGGSIVYEYRVDGDVRSWNAEGRAWFAQTLANVVRGTGFAAEERVDHLLRAQGVPGVLAEVEQIGSSYVQRRYLSMLLVKTRLNDRALASAMDVATRHMDSDYEMAEWLIAVALRYQLLDESRRAYLAGVRSLESDYERKRALTTLLERGGASTEDMVVVLEAVRAMKSDHERAEVLRKVPVAALADDAVQAAFSQAIARFDSDYETRRSLTPLLQSDRLGPSAIDVVLTAADRVGSNHERAELLIALVRRHPLTPAQRDRVIAAAEALDSEYERGRVSSAVVRQLRSN